MLSNWEALLFSLIPSLAFISLFIFWYNKRRKYFQLSTQLSQKTFQLGINLLENEMYQTTQLSEGFDEKRERVLASRPFPSHRFTADYCKIYLTEAFKEPNLDFVLTDKARSTILEGLNYLKDAVVLKPTKRKHLASIYNGLQKLSLTISSALCEGESAGDYSRDEELINDLKLCRQTLQEHKILRARDLMEKWSSDSQFIASLSPEMLVPLLFIRNQITGAYNRSETIVDRATIIFQREKLAELIGQIIPFMSSKPISEKAKAKILGMIIKSNEALRSIYS
jgi:hypothetical protein